MAQVYENAEAVETIANSLIPTHHPDLATAKFRFIFKEKASKKGGRPVLGTVKKSSDLLYFLIDVHYLVEVPLEIWNTLEEAKRVALVDHLLERCFGEESEELGGQMVWKIREPEVQEFASILRRHGAWTEDLVNFVSVGQSIDLGYMTGEEVNRVTVETN